MPNLLAARLLLFFLVGTQSVAASSVDFSPCVGKSANWEVDSDLNNYIDKEVAIYNIVAIGPVVDSPDNLRCDLSEGWGSSKFVLSGVPLEWEGIDLMTTGDGMMAGNPLVCGGVTRTTIMRRYSVDGDVHEEFYDQDTHLLVAVFINGITYIYIKDTDLFLTDSTFTTAIIIFSIVLVLFVVVYVVGIIFSDKKKKTIRAQFDQAFWKT